MVGALIFTLFDLSNEVIQLIMQKENYLTPLNGLQMLAHIVLVMIVYHDFSHTDDYSADLKDKLIVFASFSSFMMTVQLIFYWLALIDKTSHFVKMVTESMHDVKWFLLMVFLCILSFANAIVILTKLSSDEGDPIIDKKFGIVYVDSVLSGYLLGLGEFETDGYNDNKFHDFLWVYFLLATFLTQIIFVNTLIAILGSTYERIIENKHTYALIEQVKIYNDFMHFIEPMEKLKKAKFMYVIKPQEMEANQVESSIKQVSQKIESSSSENHASFESS